MAGLKKAEPLFQVNVETSDKRVIAVGPKVIKPLAEEIVTTINTLISAGKEKAWSNPHLVRVPQL